MTTQHHQQGSLFNHTHAHHPRHVLSYGLGLDSTVMVTLHCCRRGP